MKRNVLSIGLSSLCLPAKPFTGNRLSAKTCAVNHQGKGAEAIALIDDFDIGVSDFGFDSYDGQP